MWYVFSRRFYLYIPVYIYIKIMHAENAGHVEYQSHAAERLRRAAEVFRARGGR